MNTTRLIDTFPERQRLSLDGLWDFYPAAEPAPRPPRGDVYCERLAVPGVWESALRHYRHRGVGWYSRRFHVPGAGPVDLRLVFEAVSQGAAVWLDGVPLGGHDGAHTPFAFVVRDLPPGGHDLVLMADNRYGPHAPLHYPGQDIYLYGGPLRSIYAEVLPPQPLTAPCAVPVRLPRGWALDVRGVPPDAAVSLDGRALGRGPGRHPAGRVTSWSPEAPRLYTVRITTATDVWQERVGFRTIAVRGRQLLLNGKPLELRGVNRHEFHPDTGPAVPAAVHLRDIEILKQLGANFVRGSHYPNDPLFLDLCDEHGILVWEELSHWQPRAADWANPVFLDHSRRQLDEMVSRDRHHASIILWGMLNEGATHLTAARRVVRDLAQRFRRQDPTRLVTFATNHIEDDRCYDLVDVAAINIYPGWYGGDLAGAGAETERRIRVAARQAGRRPLVLSEFGGAAIYGARAMETRRWTEGYQAELLRAVITAARRTGLVSGLVVWQYCDVRTDAELGLSRPREYNNKGLLNEYRQPKLAFETVRQLYRPGGT